MPRKHPFIPDLTDEAEPALVILLDRLRGGGTEAQSLWLSEVLRGEGIAAGLCVLLPPASGQQTEGFKDVGGLFASFREFLKSCRDSPPKAVLCMGRGANCLGFLIKRRFPEVRLIASCRTNRPLPLLYRKTIRSANACLCNSQWAAERLSRLGKRSKGAEFIRVIPNALLRPDLLLLDRGTAARQAARASFDIESDGAVLCMVASFVKGKNQSGLLRAVSQLPRPLKPYLIFAGEGPERANCEALAQKLGLVERTRFPGRVDDLAPVFAASDVCVSTSLRDSLPNALIEAQAAGVPVVAYNVAGVSEAFLPDHSGYAIPPDNEPALGTAIEALVGDPGKARAFGQAGRDWAEKKFAPDSIASAYRESLVTICPALERSRDPLEKRRCSAL